MSSEFTDRLELLGRIYREGNQEALIEAIQLCAASKHAWPDWVQKAIRESVDRWSLGKTDSIELIEKQKGRMANPIDRLAKRRIEESVYFLVEGVRAGRKSARLHYRDSGFNGAYDVVAAMFESSNADLKRDKIETYHKSVKRRIKRGDPCWSDGSHFGRAAARKIMQTGSLKLKKK